MAKGIKCTCGHSWNKSDSSKKDMYVCHMCGKDNTMKDGGWLDNYGKKPNPNEVDVSVGPGFVGMSNDTTGRNYSPAWGGQFQSGGFLQPISYKLPSRYRIPYAEPSTELATSIGGVNGEPAYLIPTFKGGKDLKDPVDEYRKTGEHLGGPFKTWQEAEKWEQEIRHPYVEKGKPIPTPLKRWGDMEDGGNIAQGGKSIPTTADSARLFNSQMALNKFYDNEMKAGKIRKFPRSSYSSADVSYNFSPSSLKRLNEENLRFYREKIKERNTFRGRGIYDENYAEYFNLSPEKVRELENKGLAQTKGNSEYQQYYRDLITPMQNLASPFALVDSRIRPQGQISYGPIIDGTNKNIYPGGSVSVFDYDPLAIKPYHMRTDKEKIEWEKKYGKKTTTEKSKTELEKKKTPVIKKSEETKPAPYTPKGSKRYIVNGIEVSEEDFLGTGSTTGGSKRIIYSTPKLKDRKVLRLDGTPETDPEKIRKAMRAQEKDGDMAMGGSLPGAVGFTYARTVNPAPSNGKYAKKTKASAQDGKELGSSKQPIYLTFNTDDPAFQSTEVSDFSAFDPKNFQGLKKTLTDYMSSPLYLDRLSKSIPNENAAKRAQQKRVKNIEDIKFNPEGESTNYYKGVVSLGVDDFNDNAMVMHELAHGANPFWLGNKNKSIDNFLHSIYKRGYDLRDTEINKLNIPLSSEHVGDVESAYANYDYKPYKDLHYRPTNESKTIQQTAASETYGDLTGIRQLLFENKATNQFGQELTPEIWEKALENRKILNNPVLKRMKLKFSDEDIIKMNNEVAKSNSMVPIDRAQNGKEMKFYQEGFDFKPNSIAQDGGAIVDPMGQWAHPGEVTIIPGTDITMEGVDYPVLGISDTGDTQMMYPGEDYDFDGEYVTEYPIMKNGGWLSKFDTAQGGGTFMSKLISKEDANLNKNRGDMASYFPEIKRIQEKPEMDKAIAKAEQKRKQNILAEAVARAKGKQETVTQDNRTPRQKEIAQQQVINAYLDEAKGKSPLAQTLSSFTPTGTNQAAGKIAAENVADMTPIMSGVRISRGIRDPENNPYGIGQGNGFLANTLGTLGLVGDAFDIGAVMAPGVKSAGKYLTEQTPLKNTYKLNPFAFEPTEGMMYRGLGEEGMRDAMSSGVFRAKQDVPPSMVGNFDLSKQFDKAYYSPEFNIADQYGQGYIAEVPRTASDWGKRYGNKEWSQIAQRDIPITEGKILQKDWLRGYKEVPQPSGVATPNLGSAIEQSAPLKNISEKEAIAPNVESSWKQQELPGLHLSSTMEGGPISKIVEPKTGLVNVEQALGIIAKESGGASKASIIKKALGKDLPKKMDYNDFRKTVQDQLIPLDKEVVSTYRSGYGIDNLGYTKLFGADKNKLLNSINDTKAEILKLEASGESDDYLDILKANLEFDLKQYNNFPLENQTIRLSNKDKFGRGSSAHDNPEETLGHIHFIRDAESPDVLTTTQMQADPFQGTHRSMPKSLEESEFSLQNLENILSQRNNVLESLKKQKEELLINKADKGTIRRIDEEIDTFTKLIEDQKVSNKLNKAEVENFAQKSLLDKNHQERFLQELVDYAGKRGDVNKVRLPTRETAAKVQRYDGIDSEEFIKKYNEELTKNPNYINELKTLNDAERKAVDEILSGKRKGMIYDVPHETILKKYSELPKLIKKLFGQEIKIVTDSKGNSWYEFDIPDKFKGGKGEIKAFKDGGWLNKYK